MNIFFLDRRIQKCVEYHCDRHVVKMILEYAQLLSSVHRVIAPEYEGTHYKLTHKNHPCAIWARDSFENYAYLYNLAVTLGEEYTYRYGKVHKSISIIEAMPLPVLPDKPFVEPPKCVHDDFKSIEDTVEAYRAYYNRDKAYFCKWTGRNTPYWFNPQ